MVVAKRQAADGGFDNAATAVGAADDSSENLAHFDRWRDTDAQTSLQTCTGSGRRSMRTHPGTRCRENEVMTRAGMFRRSFFQASRQLCQAGERSLHRVHMGAHWPAMGASSNTRPRAPVAFARASMLVEELRR
jgi:hypothetical protein